MITILIFVITVIIYLCTIFIIRIIIIVTLIVVTLIIVILIRINVTIPSSITTMSRVSDFRPDCFQCAGTRARRARARRACDVETGLSAVGVTLGPRKGLGRPLKGDPS